MPTRALAREREAERPGTRDAGASLTTDQKEATVQKWADWILKQRQAAETSRGEALHNRASA
jgi:hypothetical protein